MVIQNISIEGAYDEAIEDAANRIHEASRPQHMISSSGVLLVDEKNDNSDNFDDISALGFDNTTSIATSDTYTDDDDIESNILYLEEKQIILKNVKFRREKEQAYIAVNAHNDIVNGRESSSRLTGPSSIWSEAKAIIDECRVVGVKGSRIEEEESNSSNSNSAPDICLSLLPLSSSLPDSYVNNTSRTRKRPKIDLSMVKHISSAQFAKEYATNEAEVNKTEDGGDQNHMCITGRSPIYQNCISSTGRWQQAREMQLATDSRNWISQAALKQILALTNTAISEHRHSIIATGRSE
jgi:hypothetical protein